VIILVVMETSWRSTALSSELFLLKEKEKEKRKRK